MKRRDFLAGVGLGAAGYSVAVRADGAEPGPAPAPPAADHKPSFERIAPADDHPGAVPHEPHMGLVRLECDVFVAGGGLAGVCAALAAARNGARVVLVQDRSRLGGNSSSEVKMHVVGANTHKSRPGWREGGLIEEIRLDDAVNNPQRSFEFWDLLLYDKLVSEPNVTLLLDTVLYSAETRDGRISRVMARSDKTEHLYEIHSKLYLDCTGDSRLGLEAGAEMRWGRESRAEFGESLAPESPDKETLGSSVLFTATKHDRPMPYTPPKWARKVTKNQLRMRQITSWEYGYWWIEWGGQLNTIKDNERIRFELLSIVTGLWDHIKNSGEHPSSANWAMDWVGMIPGKRESRRLIGDHVLTQYDLMGLNGEFDDAVAIGGWPMDDHPPGGFDRADLPPAVQVKTAEVYGIPYRSLYSKNVGNLLMAGRNISATHVAFTSTRVMATCAVIGQAAGTAAALCARHGLSPRELGADKARVAELQQTLLRDDQTIKNRRNEDPRDLARAAKVTASSERDDSPASDVLNGSVRALPGGPNNRWAAEMDKDGAWVELTWDTPQTIRQVQVTFDTGFQRELTLSKQDGINKGVIRAPQPETVRDYTVSARTSTTSGPTELARVDGNHQRVNRLSVGPVVATSLRLHVRATNGDPLARVFEIRCYA
ncbi:MAG: FAD-dependent oxidoreductase [Planctomycetia bacterium]|nr:FAD-dependent oxidoreductase [Planctomycetia bacterium]